MGSGFHCLCSSSFLFTTPTPTPTPTLQVMLWDRPLRVRVILKWFITHPWVAYFRHFAFDLPILFLRYFAFHHATTILTLSRQCTAPLTYLYFFWGTLRSTMPSPSSPSRDNALCLWPTYFFWGTLRATMPPPSSPSRPPHCTVHVHPSLQRRKWWAPKAEYLTSNLTSNTLTTF